MSEGFGSLRLCASILGVVALAAFPTVAFAQAAGGGAPSGGGGSGGAGGSGGGGSTGGGGASGGASGGTTTGGAEVGQVQYFPGGVAPPPPGSTLGGGNVTSSSSKPITGPNDRDGFDFGGGAGAGGTFRGSTNSGYVLGGGGGNSINVPGTHLVRKGDTLWSICDTTFHNPYQWPRVWSYNPQIQNPHWIYPGDQIRLKPGGSVGDDVLASGSAPGNRGLVTRRRVSPGTLFLQNQGYVDDADTQTWGEISGSREDKMFLTNFDEVYLKFDKDHDIKLGQELTVFRQFEHAGADHRLVEVQGTVRIDFYNPKERVARGRITETVDTIERGARIGPVMRKIEIVPPKRNEKDVQATVLASVLPQQLYGANQIVFLDKGDKDGLAPGNRLFVIRKGDAWHDSLTTQRAARRIAAEKNDVGPPETIEAPRDVSSLPEEVTAEIRVITVRDHSAMALVTSSRREIEKGEGAVARRGY